jgi:hypothetical protein
LLLLLHLIFLAQVNSSLEEEASGFIRRLGKRRTVQMVSLFIDQWISMKICHMGMASFLESGDFF